MTLEPTVSVLLPVLNEEASIERTLASIAEQSYQSIVEILVLDGGSTDNTRSLAEGAGAKVLDNPKRIQAAAMNVGIAAAIGDVVVRVDGHCTLERDYIERCVAALQDTGAAIVGGAMRPAAEEPDEMAIAVAMSSPFGVGPARFHRGGSAGWVDTVYLGSFWTETARRVGGYAEDVGVNEDAEFAVRMAAHGGVWFDPAIRSSYVPRRNLTSIARQFYRYGRSRAATSRRHPTTVRPRQLAAPMLVLGLLSRRRKIVAAAYLAIVGSASVMEGGRLPDGSRVRFCLAVATMHLTWGAGFLHGLVAGPARATRPQSTS